MAESIEGTQTGWADMLAEGRLPQFALICLGVWLNAADSLVTATVMPSVGADLGGYSYFSWAVAGFLVGAIMAGASAGRLSEMFGLRLATSFSGFFLAAGCALSAAAPDMMTFLVGRLMQGIGSGWIAGFAMVAIAVLFPERHLARVFAAVSAVWGVATILGPLFGGVFAESGNWRWVFWLFSLQALVFGIAAPLLLKNAGSSGEKSGIPWLQLALLGLGVTAISLADIAGNAAITALMAVAGLGVMALILKVDANAKIRLMPHRAGDLRTICGAGYAALFALTACSMGLSVYGPAILQELHGLSPLWAGYVIGVEALSWTLAAFAVAGVTGDGEKRWIRTGAASIFLGAALLALFMAHAPLAWIIVAAIVMGSGFGFSSSLMNRRILGVLSKEDRAIGASAFIAVRQSGGAVGAAIAGASANLVGFGAGLTAQTAEASAIWVFLTALPMAAAGLWAAWRLGGKAVAAAQYP